MNAFSISDFKKTCAKMGLSEEAKALSKPVEPQTIVVVLSDAEYDVTRPFTTGKKVICQVKTT